MVISWQSSHQNSGVKSGSSRHMEEPLFLTSEANRKDHWVTIITCSLILFTRQLIASLCVLCCYPLVEGNGTSFLNHPAQGTHTPILVWGRWWELPSFPALAQVSAMILLDFCCSPLGLSEPGRAWPTSWMQNLIHFVTFCQQLTVFLLEHLQWAQCCPLAQPPAALPAVAPVPLGTHLLV